MSLEEALNEVSDDVARAGAEQFRSRAIEALREAGARVNYDVKPVVQSFTPVEEQSDGSYSFRVTHPQAVLMEYGSDPHTITPTDPDGVLAFEQDGETVFAKKVDHPGTEALLYISTAKNELDARGLTRQRVKSLE